MNLSEEDIAPFEYEEAYKTILSAESEGLKAPDESATPPPTFLSSHHHSQALCPTVFPYTRFPRCN